MLSRLKSSSYQSYRTWLKSVQGTDATRSKNALQPFNELNHSKVVSSLREMKLFEKSFSHAELINLWKDMMDAKKVSNKQIVLNNGVREGLASLFSEYRHCQWLIPSNIYPVYSMLAESAGASRITEYDALDRAHLFRMLNSNICRPAVPAAHSVSEPSTTTDIKGHAEVLLITDPTPFGGEMTSAEIGKLLRWVTSKGEKAPNPNPNPNLTRRIVIDGVYSAELRREFLSLIESNKVYFLHSLSKTHALPLHMGVVITPMPSDNADDVVDGRVQQALGRKLREVETGTSGEKQAELRFAGFGMSTYPDMMREQGQIYQKLWAKTLETDLQPVTNITNIDIIAPMTDPAAEPLKHFSTVTNPLLRPVSSYLNISNVPFKTAFERNILGIPTSIYQSDSHASSSRADINSTESVVDINAEFSVETAGNTIFSILHRMNADDASNTLAAAASMSDRNGDLDGESDGVFTQTMYHVTRCSNFARGFDKYSRTYDKSFVQESTYPDQFYLLYLQELYVGVNKTAKSLFRDQDRSIDVSNIYREDYPIVLQTRTKQRLRPSPSGVAQYIQGSSVVVDKIGIVLSSLGAERGKGWISQVAGTHDDISNSDKKDGPVILTPTDDVHIEWLSVEELYAKSMQLNDASLTPFSACKPRSISILPVAQGCQAKCAFCFSHSSISDDVRQKPRKLTMRRINTVLDAAKAAGAERAVITGGGEPLVSPFSLICKIVRACADRFPSVTMITNGYAISQLEPDQRLRALIKLCESGLTVLSVSRHGITEANNTQIMTLETQADRIAECYHQFVDSVKRDGLPATSNPLERLRLRWVCVLQKGGVDSTVRLREYLNWVVHTRVQEVCFKELYVSSTDESLYYDGASNQYSRDHQVSLRLLTTFLIEQGAKEIGSLPWGCPIYELIWIHPISNRATTLKIVAYTEPTVYWERQNKLCRSWNLMADGDCYSSLETNDSLLTL